MNFFRLLVLLYLVPINGTLTTTTKTTTTTKAPPTCEGRYSTDLIGVCIRKKDCTGALIHGQCTTKGLTCCIPDPDASEAAETFISAEELAAITSSNTRVTAISKVLREPSSGSGCSEKAAFLAQLAHECGNFDFGEEVKNNEADFDVYDGRTDLGNTEPGDGRKFRGRGFIMITGRYNYKEAGEYIGVDLVNNPELAAMPTVAAKLAAWYWTTRNLGKYADGTFYGHSRISISINGGLIGFADRANKLEKAMRQFGCDSLKIGKGEACGFGEVSGYCRPLCPNELETTEYCGCKGKSVKKNANSRNVCAPGGKININIVCCSDTEDPVVEKPCCSPDIRAQIALYAIKCATCSIPKLCNGRCDDSTALLPQVCCTPEILQVIASIAISCPTCAVPNLCRKCAELKKVSTSSETRVILEKDVIEYYYYSINEASPADLISININQVSGSADLYTSVVNETPNKDTELALTTKNTLKSNPNIKSANMTVKDSVKKIYIGIKGKSTINELTLDIRQFNSKGKVAIKIEFSES